MELTAEVLRAELANMREQRDQLEVDFHAVSGAIKFCEALVARLDKDRIEVDASNFAPVLQPKLMEVSQREGKKTK